MINNIIVSPDIILAKPKQMLIKSQNARADTSTYKYIRFHKRFELNVAYHS